MTGDCGALPVAEGKGTGSGNETLGRGVTSFTEGISGIVKELADARGDLLFPTLLHEGGSGETNSSETEDESKESDEERRGRVAP